MDTAEPQREARRHATLLLWLANVAAGIAVGTAYLTHVPDDIAVRTRVFVCLGLVSSVATLALVPGAVFALAMRVCRSPWRAATAASLVGSAFLTLLTIDTFVYSLLGYHFDSAVWNVFVTRGSGDAIVLGAKVWGSVLLGSSLIAAGQLGLWALLYRRRLAHGPKRRAGAGRALVLRPVTACAAVLLLVVSAEKTIYAAAALEGDRQVHSVSQILPMYPHLSVSQLLPEALGEGRTELPEVEFIGKGAPLAYPRAWPVVDADGPRPNVLLLVLDSWRQDQLGPEVTPELWRFAQGARVFTDHVSGGNGTRFGVFSMLYGLYGSYWFSVLEERRSPVLLDVLARLGYERAVFSSASQSFPEFRETAWVDMPDAVFDDYPAEHSWQRDRLLAETFRGWLGARVARGEDDPFFAFVLLDSPHQPYFSPPGGPFQPAAEELDYMELARSDDPALVERLFNRYRNALHHGDRVAGDVIAALEDLGLLEDTLVVVTGDHGEEFQETGYWGHTSNFTRWQLAVPMLVKGPGVEPGTERRPTSHNDLPAALLELLGADPADRPSWTSGGNLFHPEPDPLRVVSGWHHLGVVTEAGTFRLRMGSRNPLDVELFDARWRTAAAGAQDAYQEHAGALERMARECRTFLR